MEEDGVHRVHQLVDHLGHSVRGGDAGVADGEVVHVFRAHFRRPGLGKGKGLPDLRLSGAQVHHALG